MKKSTVYILLNGIRHSFPLKSGTGPRYIFSLLLFKIVLEFQVRVIKNRQKEIQGIQIKKEELKLPVCFAVDMIVNVEFPHNLQRQKKKKMLLSLINDFVNVVG